MKSKMKLLNVPRKDLVYLLFEALISPGKCVEARPTSALRTHGGSGPLMEVPLDSVRPFRAFRFGPRSGCAESNAAWAQESNIFFTSVRLTDNKECDDEIAQEMPAWLVTHHQGFSASESASDVVFIVENRGTKPVTFTGHIEGSTLAEKAR